MTVVINKYVIICNIVYCHSRWNDNNTYQGCGSATRFRDCHTKNKIKKTCSQQPLTWSRGGPSLLYITRRNTNVLLCQLHEMYIPRS